MGDDSRQSRNATNFETLSNSGLPSVFGYRPYLQSEGREIANIVAEEIRRNPPKWVEDPEDVSLTDVMKYLDRGESDREAIVSDLLVSLLSEGLDEREAIIWHLYEYAGLTPREIHRSLKGRPGMSVSEKRARIGERTIKAELQSAGDKLGVSVDFEE